MIRTCKICGKEFDVKTCAVLCSIECRKKNEAILRKQNYEKTFAPKKHNKKGSVKSNRQAITDLAVEARQHGMTYGQYVGLMYMRGDK